MTTGVGIHPTYTADNSDFRMVAPVLAARRQVAAMHCNSADYLKASKHVLCICGHA